MATGVITQGAAYSSEDPLERLLEKLGLPKDGFALPVFSGAEDADDEDDDQDDSDNSDDSDDDDADDTDDNDDDDSNDSSKSKKSKGKAKAKSSKDDDDDDDDDDPSKSKNPEVRKLAQYAAKKRNLAKKRKETIEKQNATIDDLTAKLKDKTVSSDKKVNDRIAKLEKERDEALARATKAESKVADVSINRQVASAAKDLKVKENAKFVRFALQENDMFEVEDGDVEDLERNIKRLIKMGELSVVESSDDDDDDSGDEDKSLTRGGSRSGKSMKGKRGKKDKFDRASLEAKYPALAGR